MPEQRLPVVLKDFQGLNLLDQDEDLAFNASLVADNFFIEGAQIKNRPYARYLSGNTPLQDLILNPNGNPEIRLGDVIPNYKFAQWVDNLGGVSGLFIIDLLGQCWYLKYENGVYTEFNGGVPMNFLNGPNAGATATVFVGSEARQIRLVEYQNQIILFKVAPVLDGKDRYYIIEPDAENTVLRVKLLDPPDKPTDSGSNEFPPFVYNLEDDDAVNGKNWLDLPNGSIVDYIVEINDLFSGRSYVEQVSVTLQYDKNINFLFIPVDIVKWFYPPNPDPGAAFSWAGVRIYRRDTVFNTATNSLDPPEAEFVQVLAQTYWIGNLGVYADDDPLFPSPLSGVSGLAINTDIPPPNDRSSVFFTDIDPIPGAPPPPWNTETIPYIWFQDYIGTGQKTSNIFFNADEQLNLDEFDATMGFIHQDRMVWGIGTGGIVISKQGEFFRSPPDLRENILVQQPNSVYHGISLQNIGVVFTNGGIFHIIGTITDVLEDGSFELYHAIPNIRCLSQIYTAIDESNNMYFLAEDGFYRYNLQSIQVLSENVRPLFESLRASEVDYPSVSIDQMRNLLLIRFRLLDTSIYVYHYGKQGVLNGNFRAGDWTRWFMPVQPEIMTVARPTEITVDTPNTRFPLLITPDEMYHLVNREPQVLENTYTFQWNTKFWDGGVPHKYKMWTELRINTNMALTTSLIYDENAPPVALGTIGPNDPLNPFTGFRDIVRKRLKCKSSKLQLGFTSSAIETTSEIKSLEVAGLPLGK